MEESGTGRLAVSVQNSRSGCGTSRSTADPRDGARARRAKVARVPAPVVVDDPADPRLADYVDLADPDLRRRVEADRGFFIAESPLVVRRLLASGRHVRSVLVTPAQYDALARRVRPGRARRARLRRAPTRCCAGSSASTCTAARSRPPNAGRSRRSRTCSAAPAGSPCSNASTTTRTSASLFRSAAALGVDAVPARPRVLRPAVPPLRAGLDRARAAHPVDAGRRSSTRSGSRPHDVRAHPRGRRDRARHRRVARARRVALRRGGPGPVRRAGCAAADHRVRIPMQPGADSLNVATAAAVGVLRARRHERLNHPTGSVGA